MYCNIVKILCIYMEINEDIEAKELVVCPECNKVSHRPAPFRYNPCSSCGTIFNKNGKERRGNIRTVKAISCILHIEGAFDKISVSAKTIDISTAGAGITYTVFPLPQNSIVELGIVDMSISRPAVVAWSKEISKIESISGLRFVRPIQLTHPSTA